MPELTIDPTELEPGDMVLSLADREEGGCHCDVKVTVRRSDSTRKLCPPCRTGDHHDHQTEVMDHVPCECPHTSCKYTEAQLSAALDAVKDPEGWKNVISTSLPAVQVARLGGTALIAEAISYFCGSPSEIFPDPDRPGYVRVEAAGYYACIGS